MTMGETAPLPQGRPKARLVQFLDAMTQLKASDLHIKANLRPHFRTARALVAAKGKALTAEDVESLAQEMLNADQRLSLAGHGSVDLAYESPGADRFRINMYRQRGLMSIAVRRVTREIPNFKSLNLPPELAKICEAETGLVLVSGPTGCGKSTTIASMLDHINQRRACHILTIEDPIEYVFEDKKAVISQREVGIDVPDYHAAQRDLMRQNPDVILIGELRDLDSFQAALHAAETGHLVFGTVHAATAAQTVGRVLSLFSGENRALIRSALAQNLHAVICQKLLASLSRDYRVVPALEIMLDHAVVRKYIQEGRENELTEVVRTLEREGMRSFSTSLLELIDSDMVAPDEAYAVAPNPEELRMMVRGISNRSNGGMASR
ncbi:MAG: PilT/PilU family type 4a pilus ATPase [Planctomycetaceae bacterium]|nr:PilT/PilU family type 4a pilus ATPase [Planctomycetaceae bacterium]